MTIAHPLQWPAGAPRTPQHQRQRAKFGRVKETTHRAGDSNYTRRDKEALTIAEACARLYRQLELLRAESVVISSNLILNLDGSPRSKQAEPDDVGVCLYFRRKGRQYALPCDRWDRTSDNIAAVAGHLDAIRSQERWGVGTTEQAFAGFEALPPPKSWREILGIDPRAKVDAEVINFFWRSAAAKHHPDRGGSTARMAEINAARDAALQEIGR